MQLQRGVCFRANSGMLFFQIIQSGNWQSDLVLTRNCNQSTEEDFFLRENHFDISKTYAAICYPPWMKDVGTRWNNIFVAQRVHVLLAYPKEQFKMQLIEKPVMCIPHIFPVTRTLMLLVQQLCLFNCFFLGFVVDQLFHAILFYGELGWLTQLWNEIPPRIDR